MSMSWFRIWIIISRWSSADYFIVFSYGDSLKQPCNPTMIIYHLDLQNKDVGPGPRQRQTSFIECCVVRRLTRPATGRRNNVVDQSTFLKGPAALGQWSPERLATGPSQSLTFANIPLTGSERTGLLFWLDYPEGVGIPQTPEVNLNVQISTAGFPRRK